MHRRALLHAEQTQHGKECQKSKAKAAKGLHEDEEISRICKKIVFQPLVGVSYSLGKRHLPNIGNRLIDDVGPNA